MKKTCIVTDSFSTKKIVKKSLKITEDRKKESML